MHEKVMVQHSLLTVFTVIVSMATRDRNVITTSCGNIPVVNQKVFGSLDQHEIKLKLISCSFINVTHPSVTASAGWAGSLEEHTATIAPALLLARFSMGRSSLSLPSVHYRIGRSGRLTSRDIGSALQFIEAGERELPPSQHLFHLHVYPLYSLAVRPSVSFSCPTLLHALSSSCLVYDPTCLNLYQVVVCRHGPAAATDRTGGRRDSINGKEGADTSRNGFGGRGTGTQSTQGVRKRC